MSRTPEILSKRCQGLYQGAGQAIQWVADVRPGAQRLDRDADGLIERLRRSRNLARRLGQAARRPMSAGFFGLSQAGKSYLISSLARGDNGRLETVLDGERLDFIDHINPPGGGKEATGLVTRFTRKPQTTTRGYPVLLSLLNEADMVKILGNSFFLDFDRERASFDISPETIRDRLKDLEARRQPKPTGGMDEDDVVDLADYFDRRFRKSNEPLAGVFWPTAIGLAPYLLPQDRARLFALVWGELPEFTDAYARLRGVLQSLSFASEVHAPTSTLVEKSVDGYVQTNSIMNVDAVRVRFGTDVTDLVAVLPVVDGQPLAEVKLQRSLLAALTKEMVFVLAEPPRVDLLEELDLLDFPGYRGRMGLTSVAQAAAADEGSDPVGTLLLRGKVAYLFERYTDDQEMNVLILCNPSDKQIEITALGPVLDSWVQATQGATAAERARRAPGLLWALTMFDKRLGDSMSQSESNLDMKWDGMLTLALLERFGKAAWVQEWSGGKAFDNLFMVRKPGMSKGIFELDGEQELAVKADVQADIDRMRATFTVNKMVQRHVAEPGAAWDAMIGCDDGGMSRIVAHLRKVAHVGNKLDRIGEQVDHIQRELVEIQLGTYYRADGADEVERKKRLVDMVLNELRQRPTSFGEVLRALQPSAEHLRALYLKAEDDAVEAPAATPGAPPPPAFGGGGLISLDIFAAAAPASPAAGTVPATTASAPTGRAALFAKAVISDWLRELRQLPESAEMRAFLGLGSDALQGLVDEVITGAMRFRLEEKLVESLHKASNRAAATRSKLADQQVLVATTIVNDYVDYLGLSEVEPAQRPASVVPGRTVFRPPQPIIPGTLPTIDVNPLPYSGIFIMDWFEAFRATAIANAGHAAGSEISPEQNERLGQILNVIAGASLGAPQLVSTGA
ncbi:MAG TPA: putative virulence factor [Magnetospirillum sp.]|nr:putative virulence factor [Magnetospirillum sp.]